MESFSCRTNKKPIPRRVRRAHRQLSKKTNGLRRLEMALAVAKADRPRVTFTVRGPHPTLRSPGRTGGSVGTGNRFRHGGKKPVSRRVRRAHRQLPKKTDGLRRRRMALTVTKADDHALRLRCGGRTLRFADTGGLGFIRWRKRPI